MNRSQKTQKKSYEIDRREFCKTVPCAAAGVWIAETFYRDLIPEKEEMMAKKITSVKARVKSIKGTCALGHRVGDEVTFTESGVEGKICMHALYSMLPAVFAMMFDANFPWLTDPDKKTHACPDAANPVVFEIKRIREK